MSNETIGEAFVIMIQVGFVFLVVFVYRVLKGSGKNVEKEKDIYLNDKVTVIKSPIKSQFWICQKCREEIEDNFDTCWNCSSFRDDSEKTNEKSQQQ